MLSDARKAVLDGILLLFPHDDLDSLEEQEGRYAIVQRLEGERVAYWYDLADDAEQGLVGCANDYPDSKYAPFIVVDLDTGLTTEVEVAFRFGDPSTTYSFSDFLPTAIDRSPRGRKSVLAEDMTPAADSTFA
jgi:hypothetical protein